MARTLLLWLALVLLVPASHVAAKDDALLLTNARIIDPATRREFTGHVRIEGARVVAVLEEKPAAFDGETVDLTGKFLLPGLVDAHVHSWGDRAPVGDPDDRFGPEETARRLLNAGVTAYLDLGDERERIFRLRAQLREGTRVGADLHAVGTVFIGGQRQADPGGPIVVNDPAAAGAAVDDLARQKPDFIKLVFDSAREPATMTPEVMRAILARAGQLKLRSVVHIGTWQDARQAVEAGATAITHLSDTTDLPEDLARLLAAKHVYEIPTMAVQQDFVTILENHAILDSPLLQRVASPAQIEKYRELDPVEFADCPTCRWQRAGREHYRVSLRRLLAAGVPIVAGSDTGNLGTFQGFSLHRELVQLTLSGVDTWDALAAGTTRGAELLGLTMGFQPGADASFLVLGASPLEDIANTQSIERILFHGRWVDRDALAPRPAPASGGAAAQGS